MKVVLFCGGLGTRMKEYSTTIPKSMVEIGNRPLMWHLMRYYSHFGHKEFILCLGFNGEYIKRYFMEYREWLSNDFVLDMGGKDVRTLRNDIEDWCITFVDTGLKSNLGQRLLAVKDHLDDEEYFLANYSDGLTDMNLPIYIEEFKERDKIAGMLCVKPSVSFHVMNLDQSGNVRGISSAGESGIWINGGYFVFKKEIFDYIHEGEELVLEPFKRLMAENQIYGYRYEGFWAAIDTFKEKKMFDRMVEEGNMPWAVWKEGSPK